MNMSESEEHRKDLGMRGKRDQREEDERKTRHKRAQDESRQAQSPRSKEKDMPKPV